MGEKVRNNEKFLKKQSNCVIFTKAKRHCVPMERS